MMLSTFINSMRVLHTELFLFNVLGTLSKLECLLLSFDSSLYDVNNYVALTPFFFYKENNSLIS